MPKKIKLLDRLTAPGYFANEKEARAAVMAGEVYIAGQRAQPGQTVLPEANIIVRGRAPFVGKGGLKLTGAINDFGIEIAGRVCIDAGACTGGFTDCLVKNGAALVYAVDVGFGQLMGSLRQNPVVVNLEKTNIGDDKLLSLDPVPTLGSVDLSYLSLRKGIPQFARVMRRGGELICLVKPLFEIEDAAARRTGVIKEESYLPLLQCLIDDINHMQAATVRNITHSPVTGNTGTREFFLHVLLQKEEAPDLSAAIYRAVEKAKALEDYKK